MVVEETHHFRKTPKSTNQMGSESRWRNGNRWSRKFLGGSLEVVGCHHFNKNAGSFWVLINPYRNTKMGETRYQLPPTGQKNVWPGGLFGGWKGKGSFTKSRLGRNWVVVVKVSPSWQKMQLDVSSASGKTQIRGWSGDKNQWHVSNKRAQKEKDTLVAWCVQKGPELHCDFLHADRSEFFLDDFIYKWWLW